MNRNNYRFSDKAYPIISDKRARNMIEHIDEHNQTIISTQKGVGGFNLIDNTVDCELIDVLRKKRDLHPYTIDLIEKKILIRRKTENIDIEIDELKKELIELQKNVKSFEGYLR